jgi:hypothetical protein
MKGRFHAEGRDKAGHPGHDVKLPTLESSKMKWISLPSPYPEVSAWGCWIENWQYVLSYNSKSRLWATTVKPLGRTELPKTLLGWFATREEAIEAVEQHNKKGSLGSL